MKKTKREIQKILKDRFNIDVTLRPRKATLERLLKDAISKSTKDGCCGYYTKECEFSQIVLDTCSVTPSTPWIKYIAMGLFFVTLLVLLPV